jgi:hypothetical protein
MAKRKAMREALHKAEEEKKEEEANVGNEENKTQDKTFLPYIDNSVDSFQIVNLDKMDKDIGSYPIYEDEKEDESLNPTIKTEKRINDSEYSSRRNTKGINFPSLFKVKQNSLMDTSKIDQLNMPIKPRSNMDEVKPFKETINNDSRLSRKKSISHKRSIVSGKKSILSGKKSATSGKIATSSVKHLTDSILKSKSRYSNELDSILEKPDSIIRQLLSEDDDLEAQKAKSSSKKRSN